VTCRRKVKNIILYLREAMGEYLNQSNYPKMAELTFLRIVDQIVDLELTF